ncbi:hypothetical protein WN943_006068 [Citrus x changshan-huyou]
MTGLLHVQGRPATTYDDQGPVFAVAFGGYIRMFDAHSDAVKFSNDGRLMLPTSMEGHIRVLDSFQGTLVSLLFLSSSPKLRVIGIVAKCTMNTANPMGSGAKTFRN